MKHRIRVVVVDDHALFRRGLISLLAEFDGFSVVGEAGNGSDGVRMIVDQKPDVVLLDFNMPGMSGVETIQALRKAKLTIPVIMLTVSQDENDLMDAILAGASGYLLKSAEPDSLRTTLLDAAAGNSILSPEMIPGLFNAMRRMHNAREEPLLSDREMDVLRSLSRGKTTAQISAELFISENTVKTHIRHILEKMDVKNRAEAVAKALQARLL